MSWDGDNSDYYLYATILQFLPVPGWNPWLTHLIHIASTLSETTIGKVQLYFDDIRDTVITSPKYPVLSVSIF